MSPNENLTAPRNLFQQDIVYHCCKMQEVPQTFRDVRSAGLPVPPLDFPTPEIHPAAFLPTQTVMNHHYCTRSSTTEAVLHHRNIRLLCRTGSSSNASHNAYWIKKPIARTAFGSIQLAMVVHRRCCSSLDYLHKEEEEIAEWITTDETVAIKTSAYVRNYGECMSVDGPLKEAACLQLIGNYHPNILGCIEVLQDEDCLFTVLPYCPGGNITSYIPSPSTTRKSSRNRDRQGGTPRSGDPSIASFSYDTSAASATLPFASSIATEATCSDRTIRTVSTESTPCREYTTKSSEHVSNEPQVRIWFLQLLEALRHLQKKGVCHRNIQPSNILIESKESNNLVLIDFSSAIRVPYKDDSNLGGVADVSQGTRRLLIHEDSPQKLYNTAVRNDSRTRNPRLHRAVESPTNRKKSVPAVKSNVSSIYSAPELLEGQPFDGFTIDLWSAGVFLYVMLVGATHFPTPNVQLDVRYRQVNQGHLREVIRASRASVSNEVIDLLQNMLWYDPQKRLTLNEVLLQPWITGVVHPSPPLPRDATEIVHHRPSSTPPRWYNTRHFHSSSSGSATKESSTPKVVKKTRNL